MIHTSSGEPAGKFNFSAFRICEHLFGQTLIVDALIGSGYRTDNLPKPGMKGFIKASTDLDQSALCILLHFYYQIPSLKTSPKTRLMGLFSAANCD
ncbi:MAG TPA: hypothetical protein DEO43_07400 [Halieaceae bacterium]|nr:hypothetical protein [Halieaceae bacterium]